VTAKHLGTIGNAIDLRLNRNQDEATPAGLTVAAVAPTSGTGDPDLAGALTAIAAEWFTHLATGISDSTAIGRAVIKALDAAAARTALELDDAAALDVGAGAGKVAAGDDVRFLPGKTLVSASDPTVAHDTDARAIVALIEARQPRSIELAVTLCIAAEVATALYGLLTH
jgi:hypothetical protein